ncbi:MAG: sigma-70 family RNA polymerase sigma factor [Flavobacteriaceae bacterium]|nr:sigma-70 family RNA polymerase sigma factor [Flavobacteriaceae bacterium]
MSKDLKKICESKVFESFYKIYSKDLKRFLYYKFGDLNTAEDVMQDAFIKLWNNCKKVPYNKAKSFLFTVANNLFLNIKKHEKVIRKNQIHLVKSNSNETPDFLMEEKEFQLKLEKVINDLTSKQREVFLLSRIEKKKYREIAEMLEISIKAVEKRMHGVLLIMRKKIGKV